jgi:anti-sigma-K factor RskA
MVAWWEGLLAPLNDGTEPVEPPARFWRNIQSRVGPAVRRQGARAGIWADLSFWRVATFVTSAAAAVLAAWVAALIASTPPQQIMVVVMSDDRSTPALTVSWPIGDRGAERLRVRVMGHAKMDPDTAWELWMLPGGGGKPVSLGLIDTRETQMVTVPARIAAALNAAWGLAMSVEPRGGSATGLPSGPVLYKGPRAQM